MIAEFISEFCISLLVGGIMTDWSGRLGNVFADAAGVELRLRFEGKQTTLSIFVQASTQDTAILKLAAAGDVPSGGDALETMDVGHEILKSRFQSVVSPKMQDDWGRIK